MKLSFWDILSAIFLAAELVMGSAFIAIYRDPTGPLNPFPPVTRHPAVLEPEVDRTMVVLPEIWTPVPDEEEDPPAGDVSDEAETTPESQTGPGTPTPVLVITAKPTVYKTRSVSSQSNSVINLPTKNPLEPTTEADDDASVLAVTAPIGVFDNKWQNIQSLPAFSWGFTRPVPEVDHFQLYFGTKQNGKLTIKTTKMNYSWKAVKSGIYYLRLVAVAPNGMIIGKPAAFLYKYDNTPPEPPEGFVTSSTGDTAYPYFEWNPSRDAHSGMSGGYAGYSIYQGTEKKCGKPVAFTSDSRWTPVSPVEKGATMYFCVRSMDVVGNISVWVGPIAYTYSG